MHAVLFGLQQLPHVKVLRGVAFYWGSQQRLSHALLFSNKTHGNNHDAGGSVRKQVPHLMKPSAHTLQSAPVYAAKHSHVPAEERQTPWEEQVVAPELPGHMNCSNAQSVEHPAGSRRVVKQ